MTPPTDRKLLDRLKRLIDTAAAKVVRWEAQNPTATAGDRGKYRDWCHRQVWGKFLEVSSRITMTVPPCVSDAVDGYSASGSTSCVAVGAPERTYEEEMRAFYDAYNAAWEDDKWLSDDTEWLAATEGDDSNDQ